MNDGPTQEKRSHVPFLLMVLRRVAMLVVIGFIIGWILNRAEAALEKRHEPAASCMEWCKARSCRSRCRI